MGVLGPEATVGAGAGAAAATGSPWIAGLSAVSGIMGGGGGGGVEDIDPVMSDRSPIHIAPVGVNLGAILAPFNAGAPENGGYGIEGISRLLPYHQAGSVTTPLYSRDVMADTTKLIIFAAAAALCIIVIKKHKK